MRRALLALALAPAACLFPGVSDLGSSGDAAPADVAVEGAPDAGLDGPGDAPSDASAPDGADAAGAGFCASLGGAHALCEDFDEGLFSAQFTNVHTTQYGSLASDSSAWVSPPSSLLATVQARPTANDFAYMTRVFPGTASSATYSFDVRIDSWTTGGGSGVFGAVVVDDSQPDVHTLSIYATDTYSALEESFAQADGGIAFVDHLLTTPVQLGTWTRVTLSVDFANRTCSAMLDGKTVLASTPLDPSWATGPVAIDLGLSYLGSEKSAWQVRYDDVVFDFQ